MKKEIKLLVQSSMFLTICSILVIFQLPFWGFLTLDLSYISLLLARRIVGMRNAIIIACIYPLFAFLSIFPDPIGILFLIVQSLIILPLDWILNRDGFNLKGIVLTIIIMSFISYLLNLIIFTPLYGSPPSDWFFWNNPDLIWMEFIYYFTFNVTKLTIVYAITFPIFNYINLFS